MAKRNTQFSPTSSETLFTDRVSSLQRCLCGNVFRSQRQLTRFVICLAVLLLITYFSDPFGPPVTTVPESKRKLSPATVRSVAEDEKAVSEYRATYFEEMGKRFADRELLIKHEAFDPSNHVSLETQTSSQSELNSVAVKVKEMGLSVANCHQVPGMSIVMVKEGSSVKIPLGLADVESGRPVTTETKFLLNSISKTFLGQLLAVLITESSNNVTWDTRVSDILGPGFQLATEELTREMTLRDLLAHRTGLSSGNLAMQATYPDGRTRADLVRLMKHLPPSAPFRKTFLYSNMGALLATHVAETLGGAPWEQLMVEKLLTPLGMLSSQPLKSAEELEGEAVSRLYVPVEGVVTKANSRIFSQGPLNSIALLVTTASDVAKWLQFNLRHGRLQDGRQLIRPDVWSAMWMEQAKLSPLFLAGVDKSDNRWPVKDYSVGYGLFWFINKYRGLTNFWHGGGLYSHYTLAWHFPEKDVALYAVINGYSGDSKPFAIVESLAYYAADLLLGYQPWLDKSSACTYPSPWVSIGGDAPANRTTERREEEGRSGNAAGEKHGETVKSGQEKGGASSRQLGVAEKEARFSGNSRKFSAEVGSRPSGGGRDRLGVLAQQSQGAGKETAAAVHQSTFSAGNQSRGAVETAANRGDNSQNQKEEGKTVTAKFSLKSYQGLYGHPLFGNFSVILSPTSGHLECQMNMLTGILHPLDGHTFGVELTKSLRFLSKPSRKSPAKNLFKVFFVESDLGEITAVDIFSKWAMEVPLRFHKMR